MTSAADQAVALKNDGNKAFAAHDWGKAVELYTKAIELNDQEPTFYTNRAQACPSPSPSPCRLPVFLTLRFTLSCSRDYYVPTNTHCSRRTSNPRPSAMPLPTRPRPSS